MSEDEEIAEAVRTHGWQFINVYDNEPPFLYSIGLMPDHPELIIFGLDAEIASSAMGKIARRVKHGEAFEHKITYDIAPPFPRIAVRNVHPTQIPLYLGYAMGYSRLQGCGDLKAVQVFWPDKQGKFPFDVGCDEDVYARQPRLDIGLGTKDVAAWERLWQ
jgi:hypothetical protein